MNPSTGESAPIQPSVGYNPTNFSNYGSSRLSGYDYGIIAVHGKPLDPPAEELELINPAYIDPMSIGKTAQEMKIVKSPGLHWSIKVFFCLLGIMCFAGITASIYISFSFVAN